MPVINRSRTLWSMLFSTLIWLFLVSVVTVAAQETAIPIAIGENKTGNIADNSSAALYSIEVGAPQSVTVLVLAVTPGFAPTFRVLDPGGVVVLDTANPGTQTIAQGTPNLSSSGTYIIEVRSANTTPGQFLISVQPGAPLAPPQALTAGTPQNGSVDAQATRQAYSFSGSASDVLLLTVRDDNPVGGAVFALRDADTDETLSLSSARLGGIVYRILTGQANYLLEVTHSGASAAEAFTVCLATESGSVTCPGGTAAAAVVEATSAPTLIAAAPSQTPTFAPVAINPAGSCQVASARGTSINVRGGPGTGYNIVGNLSASATGLVVGRLADNSWYQVNVNGVSGWVSATVVIPGGNCAGVSVVIPPTAAATVMPPIATTEVSPNNTPTATATETMPPPQTLNPDANTWYGEVTLYAGFEPNPYTVQVQSGGSVSLQEFGFTCSGYASSIPDFRIHFMADGSGSKLSFSFSGDGATTIVVHNSYGGFICWDGSIPIPFPYTNGASDVTYTIWIASIDPNRNVSGTLSFLEIYP